MYKKKQSFSKFYSKYYACTDTNFSSVDFTLAEKSASLACLRFSYGFIHENVNITIMKKKINKSYNEITRIKRKLLETALLYRQVDQLYKSRIWLDR